MVRLKWRNEPLPKVSLSYVVAGLPSRLKADVFSADCTYTSHSARKPISARNLSLNCSEALAEIGFRAEWDVYVQSRSEEHTSELQSPDHLVCRLLLEKKK